MAYAALVSLENVLQQIMEVEDQDSFNHGAKAKIKSLHENVISLVAFLDDLPKDCWSLEERMRDAASQAESIIEGRISDELRWHYRCWGVVHCIQQVILSVFPTSQVGDGSIEGFKVRDWQKLHWQLQNVMKEVEAISEEVMYVKIWKSAKDNLDQLLKWMKGVTELEPLYRKIMQLLVSSNEAKDSSSSHIHDSAIGNGTTPVGFEKDLLEIKGRLCGEPSKLEVVPIIGIGGIGKTTLARYVYNDPLMEYHFDVRSWVTISRDFCVEKVLSSILYSVNPSTKELYDKMGEEKLLEHLYKFLKGRRYLIVMDDIWSESVWDALWRAFPDDSNGSRIIITLRNLDVASYINPSNHPYQMNFMDADQSWNLLREKVFGQECPPELEKFGKLITKNCEGLPLFIDMLAEFLSKAKYKHKTRASVTIDVDKAVHSEEFMKMSEKLYLNYACLPHYLRPCLLFMGGFPQDYEISVSRLIKLWSAEGFLKSSRSKNDLEAVAQEYLEDLIKRNLVLVMKRKSNGNIKSVKLHYVVRELCVVLAFNEKFLQVVTTNSFPLPEDIRNSRRLSTLPEVVDNFQGDDGSFICTILLPISSHDITIPWGSWKSFRMLRILDAYDKPLKHFPINLDEVFHLRYLAFSFSLKGKFKLSDSLSRLQNLQTLIIMPHHNNRREANNALYMLPSGIWRLHQLRHLIVWDTYQPDPNVEDLIVLEHFHTLSRVNSFTCSERILNLAPNLNKLVIVYPFNDIFETGWSKYELKNLVQFQILEKLNLFVESEPENFHTPFQNSCFLTLQKSDIAFPAALKKLTLSGCRLPWQDMTIIGSLSNLEVLKLRSNACYGDIWETIEGEFCRLKVLLIEKTDPQEWITDSIHFPCLQSLLLFCCQNLKEIPVEIGEIPSLQLIELDNCTSSIEESAKRIEEEQRSYGIDDLLVHILHS